MTQLDTKRIPRRIIVDCLVLVLGTAVMIAIFPSADPAVSGLQTYLTAFHARLPVADKYEKAKVVVCATDSIEC